MLRRDQVKTQIDYQAIFNRAYQLMNEPIIEGNCGELCGYHCCRRQERTGERLGMYLLPLEFEYMQRGKAVDYEVHSCQIYDMPPKIKKLYYIFCHESEGCLRDLRPVQCRTYPFEPHLDENGFSLVIEKDQIHACPLLNRIPEWRQAFIEGVYKGWLELMKIPIIKYHILYFSLERNEMENINRRYTDRGWE
ncbi:hypothetical protein [Fusibacter ferrireducens]|uniref:YkgJ family cysteine cluster protein n=1 Tax=Fusibacter ferrireducens TaxID=2785058 RepID=A0ABR9ZSN3_9FIRM|nr:hypothetical protein [Fusibacter ferrireducens]MBF4693476.1 hypothetical protein [Fusibacter ferrireducens]